MSKKTKIDVIVVRSRCGEVLIEDDIFNSCKHIDIEEVKDFYIYLDKKINKRVKKPILYSKVKTRLT